MRGRTEPHRTGHNRQLMCHRHLGRPETNAEWRMPSVCEMPRLLEPQVTAACIGDFAKKLRVGLRYLSWDFRNWHGRQLRLPHQSPRNYDASVCTRLLAVTVAGCGGSSPTIPTTPAAPTPPTATLSGVVFAATPTGLKQIEGARVRLEIGSFRLDGGNAGDLCSRCEATGPVQKSQASGRRFHSSTVRACMARQRARRRSRS